jgi:hypothetical protein
MFLPMSTRLTEEDQKIYDGMWNNMLTPVNRVDRQTLLDTTIVYMMFQLGTDRLHMVTEKYLATGKVVMEIDCDRINPASDQFTIAVLDDRGRALRRERFSRQEVEESAHALTTLPTTMPVTQQVYESHRPSTTSATAPSAPTEPASGREIRSSETPEEQSHRLELERRVRAIQAATQPATLRSSN